MTLEYTPQQGLAITTDAGYRVVVGDSQNFDYKLAVWAGDRGEARTRGYGRPRPRPAVRRPPFLPMTKEVI